MSAKTKRRQRWRGIGVERSGYGPVARIHDRDRDEEVVVYFRLGRWRRWDRQDEAVRDADLTACARRLLGVQKGA